MERNSFAMKLRPGQRARFGQILGEKWKALTQYMDASGIRNFSMWTAEDLVFGYYESQAPVSSFREDKLSEMKKLASAFDGCMDWISEPWNCMRLMYHDFGIVRESKELIRHRVFMTKLVPGSEEEYKRRHDGLVEARGDQIDPGPDSNFSIWNAGGYIFGYDEIDTTMERDRTKEDDEGDIAWETRMFEIMSWITNDVDWISGEHHAQVRRLCYHN